LHPLLSLLSSLTRQDLARQVAYLKTENKILRARLPEKIVTTAKERTRLIKAGQKLGSKLRELMSFVSYDTFRRWVREKETAATQKAESASDTIAPEDDPVTTEPKKPGRPRTAEAIRDFVIQLRKESGKGLTLIMGELRKLGIHISRQTVKNILVEAGLTPDPGETTGNSDSWDSFLKRHADTLWQCDFLSKPMLTLKGFIPLYFLVFIHLGTRRIWVSPCTAHPDSAWVSQQARNFLQHADEINLPVKIMMRDNDGKFQGSGFDGVIEGSGAKIKRTTPMSPNLRAHVERVIQTLQHEVLNYFVIVGPKHLNYITKHAMAWYNQERPHSARDHLPPACEKPPEPQVSLKMSEIVCTTRLGGLLKHYSRRAA